MKLRNVPRKKWHAWSLVVSILNVMGTSNNKVWKNKSKPFRTNSWMWQKSREKWWRITTKWSIYTIDIAPRIVERRSHHCTTIRLIISWHDHRSSCSICSTRWRRTMARNFPNRPAVGDITILSHSVSRMNIERISSILGSLRISTIDFVRIPQASVRGGYIPNGYAGFQWENAYWMSKDYLPGKVQLKEFLTAFHDSQDYVAYNSGSGPLTISVSNPEQTVGLHSCEAVTVYYSDFKVFVTGYRSNNVIGTKNVVLTNDKSTLFEIDWEGLDRITFQTQVVVESCRPSKFASIVTPWDRLVFSPRIHSLLDFRRRSDSRPHPNVIGSMWKRILFCNDSRSIDRGRVEMKTRQMEQ